MGLVDGSQESHTFGMSAVIAVHLIGPLKLKIALRFELRQRHPGDPRPDLVV